jgi:hypothetical protein
LNHEPYYPRKPRGKYQRESEPMIEMLADLLIAWRTDDRDEFAKVSVHHFMYPKYGEAQINRLKLRDKKFFARVERAISMRIIPNPKPALPKDRYDHGRVLSQEANDEKEDDGQEEMSFEGSGGEGGESNDGAGQSAAGESPAGEMPTQDEERAIAVKGVRVTRGDKRATRTKAKKAAKKKGRK